MSLVRTDNTSRDRANGLRIAAISLVQLALLACGSPAMPGDDAAPDADETQDAAQDSAFDVARDSAADAATRTDTGVTRDAGVPSDTGVPEDAAPAESGVAMDSGVVTDSGVAMDSGVVVDSGVAMDSGVVTDSGVPTDTGVRTDTGVAMDATSADARSDAASDARADSGCRAVCSGVCTDTLTSLQHCGSCGNACTVPANGSAACELGLCALRCNPGYTPNGSRCDPLAAPRLIAPLSGRWVTIADPTLRWQNNGAATGARVQVCRDPACTTVIAQFDAAMSASGRPTMALPPGVWFWRAFPMLGADVGSTASGTWSFVVPPRPSTSFDSTSHQQFDADNDGQPDLLALSTPDPASGPMEMQLVYTRGSSFVQLATPLRRETNLARPIAIGDINGDGRSDAIIRATGGCLYLGAATGMTLDTCSSASGSTTTYEYSVAAGAGDLNGDGYGDVLVPSGSGSVFVRYGSALGLGAPRDEFVLPRESGSVARVAVGDFDGDRQREIVVIRATGGGLRNPEVIPIVGGVPSDAGRRALSWGALGISPFVDINPVATDVNGDNRQDLVVALRSNDFPRRGGRLVVFLGSATGLSSTPSQLIVNPDSGDDLFGASFDRAGDINADGAEDVIVASPMLGSNTGRVYLYLGGASGLATLPAQQFDGASSGGYFGQAIVGLGTVNRDRAMGFAISAFLAPTPSTARGVLSLFVSSGTTIATPAASTANNNGMTTGYGFRLSSIGH